MKQTFETDELKRELERALGFTLRSLARLDGASALNFKAVRASDGMAFAVKCSPPSSLSSFGGLVEHLAVLDGTRAVRRVFAETCPKTFCGYNVLCTAWCDGVRIFPDKLTDAQFVTFLDDYCAFSEAMQRVRSVEAARPVLTWRRFALAKCRGLGGRLLRRTLEGEPESVCTLHPALTRVIHGDFHHGNFLFENGRVKAYLDLEEFRYGYSADDIVRYVVCAAEHLRWYAQFRKRRMLRLFALAVAHLPYSRQEWVTAIYGRYVCKVVMRMRSDRCVGLARALNFVWCHRFYAALQRIVEKEAHDG